MTANAFEPKLAERPAQPYVSIPIQATLKEWSQVNALVPEVFAWLARRGITPAGAPFYRYWLIGDLDTPFDLEVGVPVAQPVAGDGRVMAGAMSAGKYLTFTHHGHPDHLSRLHDEMQAWAAARQVEIKRRGRTGPWGGMYQSFLTNPAEQPDLSQWRIELAYQVNDDTIC